MGATRGCRRRGRRRHRRRRQGSLPRPGGVKGVGSEGREWAGVSRDKGPIRGLAVSVAGEPDGNRWSKGSEAGQCTSRGTVGVHDA